MRGNDRMPGRIRQGIQFIELDRDRGDGELRITGDDDAGMLLWAAQWLDEHREYMITAMHFQYPAEPGDQSTVATVVISLTSPGHDPDPAHTRPRLGPWPHGVPPMPLLRLSGLAIDTLRVDAHAGLVSYDPDPDGTRAIAYQRCQEELAKGNFQAAQVFATLILEEAVRDLAKQVAQGARDIAVELRR
jgi:hypothetical protein